MAGNYGSTVPAFMIAAVSSGCGKTALTMGIIGALRRKGFSVQPYKVGPDYIDPAFHSRAASRPCRNLDSWMTGASGVRESFNRGLQGADIAVIEGVMGLFDGRGGSVMDGSSAEISALLQVPVILLIDVARMSGSAAAIVAGFAGLHSDVKIAGVILNRVGSERHRHFVTRSIEENTALKVIGSIPRLAQLEMPHRHLGLVPAGEQPEIDGALEAAADAVDEYVDLDKLIELAGRAGDSFPGGQGGPRTTGRIKIAVAHDDAFNFYYHENLERLEEAGAELVYFSPLADSAVPRGVSGLILGGGFPEMFAERLSFNFEMIESIAEAVDSGMPTLAECGGLIYLCRSLTDQLGDVYRMAGIIPADARMGSGRRILGYREVEAATETPFLPGGTRIRAHEFHCSDVVPAGVSQFQPAYRVMGDNVKVDDDSSTVADDSATVGDDSAITEGFAGPSLLASYIHLHFGASPQLATRFVAACRKWSPVEAGAHV